MQVNMMKYITLYQFYQLDRTGRVIGEIIRDGINILYTNTEIRNMENNLISTGNSNLLKTHFIS